MSETYRDLGGGITDPDAQPECSWNCDGNGMDSRVEISRRPFVDCPMHRPALHTPASRRTRTRRLHVVR